jgi:alkylated DNA repair dioxygenase AlkB
VTESPQTILRWRSHAIGLFETTDLCPDMRGALSANVGFLIGKSRERLANWGFPMSVSMTNCGAVGWVTDQTGYRYDRVDPESGLPWPASSGVSNVLLCNKTFPSKGGVAMNFAGVVQTMTTTRSVEQRVVDR